MSLSPNSVRNDNSRELGNVDKHRNGAENGKSREDEDMTEEMRKEIVGNVILDEEDEVVRKIKDPKLPSQEEVSYL